MELLKDVWQFLWVRKAWWLAPVIMVLLFMGMIIIIGGSNAFAPFIYAIF